MNKVKYGSQTLTNNKAQPMSIEYNQTVVNEVANQGAKVGAVWLAIGIGSWTEAAAFLAFVLSALALTEYVWKKILRPICVSFGWLKTAKHRVKMVAVEETFDE